MKRKLTIGLIIASTAVALASGIADLVGRADLLCSASSCIRVHSSSFATAFVFPVGFYGAALLLVALALYLRGKEQAALLVLYGLVGMEGYLTFIEVVFIRSLCTSCLVFFALLVLSSVLATGTGSDGKKQGTNPVLIGFFMFFVAHFAFFFPSVELKPTLVQESEASTRVEIFASPSCPHCENALAELRALSASSNIQLVVRPVAISRSDIPTTVDWVCRKVFRCPSPTARKLAEKIVWENQEEAAKLNGGRIAVPVVVIKSPSGTRVLHGWSQAAARALREELSLRPGIGSAQAAQVQAWNSVLLSSKEESHVCSTGNACGSASSNDHN